MFKTSDLEKVLEYLKIKDIKEFEIEYGPSNFVGPRGFVSISTKFMTDDFDLSMLAEMKEREVKNGVILVKREKL